MAMVGFAVLIHGLYGMGGLAVVIATALFALGDSFLVELRRAMRKRRAGEAGKDGG
jgi:hypothetical protein